MRTFARSNTIGTTCTLTCAAVASLTDIDFRDITIAGAAAPVSGTRLGDCKGNSGITFDAAKTVYWRNATAANWGATAWSATNGGTADVTQFPLAQDTAIFPSGYPNSGVTVTLNAAYNIGAIDMSARTATSVVLSIGSQSPTFYGNLIQGTNGRTTNTSGSTLTFAGRESQTITSAGYSFSGNVDINSPGGSVTLQDALTILNSSTGALDLLAGTFNDNGYSVTLSGASSGVAVSNATIRTVNIDGTWTIAGTTGWNAATSTNLTVTGAGTIRLTSASAKTFSGGGVQTYPTINQGGTGTLTVTGSNKFANITNTAIGRVQFTGGTTNEFTAFNLNGTSTVVRLALGSTNTTQAILEAPSWNVGAGSLDSGNNTGLSFTAGTVDFLNISYINGVVLAPPFISATILESAVANSTESSLATFNISMSETVTAADAQAAGLLYLGTLSESATVSDAVEAFRAFLASVVESATSSELVSAALTLSATIAELTAGADQLAVQSVLTAPVSELAAMSDSVSGGLFFLSNISETTTAQELAAAFLAFNRAILEAAAVQDSSAVAASTFGASSAETATPLDAVQGANTGSSSLSESATASEAQAAQFTAATAVAEASTAQETAAATQLFVTRVAETAIPADTTSVAPSTFGAIALAAAQAAESFSPAGSIYNAALPVESAGITDFLVGAYLWNPIDDNQTPNWQNIANSQGSGWTQINTDDAPNWQPTIQP
jgi:hypothetical protein